MNEISNDYETNTLEYIFQEKKVIGELSPCYIEWKTKIITKSLKLNKLGICMERNELFNTDEPLIIFDNGNSFYSDCTVKPDNKGSLQKLSRPVKIDSKLLHEILLQKNIPLKAYSSGLKYALYCIDANGKWRHGPIQQCKLVITPVKQKIDLVNKVNQIIIKRFSPLQEELHLCCLEFQNSNNHNIVENTKIAINLKASREDGVDEASIRFHKEQSDLYTIDHSGKKLIIQKKLSPDETIKCNLVLTKLPKEQFTVYRIYFYLENDGPKYVVNKEPMTIFVSKDTTPMISLLLNDRKMPVEKKITPGMNRNFELCKLSFKMIQYQLNNKKPIYLLMECRNHMESYDIFFLTKSNSMDKKIALNDFKPKPNIPFTISLKCEMNKDPLEVEQRSICIIDFFLSDNDVNKIETIQPGPLVIVLEKEKPKIVLDNDLKIIIETTYSAKDKELLLCELKFKVPSFLLLSQHNINPNKNVFIRLKAETVNSEYIDYLRFSCDHQDSFTIADNGKMIIFTDQKLQTEQNFLFIKCNLVYQVNDNSIPKEVLKFSVNYFSGDNNKEEKINKKNQIVIIKPNTTVSELLMNISSDNTIVKKLLIRKNHAVQKPITLSEKKWMPDLRLDNEILALSMENQCSSGKSEDSIYITNIEIVTRMLPDNAIVLKDAQNNPTNSIEGQLFFIYKRNEIMDEKIYLRDYKLSNKLELLTAGKKEADHIELLIDNNKIKSFCTRTVEVFIDIKITCDISNKKNQEITIPFKFNITKEKSLYWLAMDFGTSAMAAMFSNGTTGELIQMNPGFSDASNDSDYLEHKKNYLYPSIYRLTSTEDIALLNGDEPFNAIMHIKKYTELNRHSTYVIPYLKSLFKFKEILFGDTDKIISIDRLIKSVFMRLFNKKESNSKIVKNDIDNILIDNLNKNKELFDNIIFSHPNNFTKQYKKLIENIVNECFDEKKTVEFMSESNAIIFLYASCWGGKKNKENQEQFMQERVLVYDLGAGTLDITYAEICWKLDANNIPEAHKISILAQYCLPKAGNYLDYVIAKGIYEIIDQTICKNHPKNDHYAKYMKDCQKLFDPDHEIMNKKKKKTIDSGKLIEIVTYKMFIEKNIKPKLNARNASDTFIHKIPNDKTTPSSSGSEKENLLDNISLIFDKKFDVLGLDENEKEKVLKQITPKNISETTSVKSFINELTKNAFDSISYIYSGAFDSTLFTKKINAVIVSGRSVNCPLIKSKLEAMFPNKVKNIDQIEGIQALKTETDDKGNEDLKKTAVVRGLSSYAGLFLNRKEDKQIEFNDKKINVRIGYIIKFRHQWEYFPIIEPWKEEDLIERTEFTEDIKEDFTIKYKDFVEIAWVTTFEKEFDDNEKKNNMLSYVNPIINPIQYPAFKLMQFDIPVKGHLIVTANSDIKIYLYKKEKPSSFPLSNVHIDRDDSFFDHRNNWPFFKNFKPVSS